MTYWYLNIGFLCAIALVALAAWLVRRAPAWRLVALAVVPLVVLTAVFDNVLVGVHIVEYDPSRISGVLVAVAPIEDFCYAIAAAVLLPCLWSLLTPRPPAGGVSDPAP